MLSEFISTHFLHYLRNVHSQQIKILFGRFNQTQQSMKFFSVCCIVVNALDKKNNKTRCSSVVILLFCFLLVFLFIYLFIYNIFHYNVILHALVFFWQLLTVVRYLYLLDLYRYHSYHCILLWSIAVFGSLWL